MFEGDRAGDSSCNPSTERMVRRAGHGAKRDQRSAGPGSVVVEAIVVRGR